MFEMTAVRVHASTSLFMIGIRSHNRYALSIQYLAQSLYNVQEMPNADCVCVVYHIGCMYTRIVQAASQQSPQIR